MTDAANLARLDRALATRAGLPPGPVALVDRGPASIARWIWEVPRADGGACIYALMSFAYAGDDPMEARRVAWRARLEAEAREAQRERERAAFEAVLREARERVASAP